MKKCPYCAEDIQDAAVVCKHCGRGLTGKNAGAVATAPVQVVKVKQQSDFVSTIAKWAVGFFILVALAAIFSAGMSTPSQRPQSNASTSPTAGPTTFTSRRNPTGAQLAALVTKVGEERCPAARRTFLQGVDATSEVWNIECSNGKSFSVTMKNSGDVSVLGCGVLKAVSKVDCFKTFAEQR